MTIQFQLSKEASAPIAFNLNKVQEYIVELYWQSAHDLDVHAFLLTNDVITGYDDIVSTYNPTLVLQSDGVTKRIAGDKRPFQNVQGSVFHNGDAKTGLNPNEALPDEQLKINLSSIKAGQTSIPFFVSIHPPANSKFKEVADLRLVIKQCDGNKLLEAHLGRDFDQYDMVQVGMLVKNTSGDWLFDPKAVGLNGDFNTLVGAFQ